MGIEIQGQLLLQNFLIIIFTVLSLGTHFDILFENTTRVNLITYRYFGLSMQSISVKFGALSSS